MPKAPIYAVCAYVIGMTVLTLGRGFFQPQPHEPFEAAQMMEGWRSAQGMAVYEPPTQGHATHMYGALASPTLGALFALFGAPSLGVTRAVSLVSALVLVALFTAIAVRTDVWRGWTSLIVPIALSLGINSVAFNYFVEGRPDMAAMAVSLIALIVLYRGYARRSFTVFVVGALLVVVSSLYKQTAAATALIPIVPILADTRGRGGWTTRIGWALFPVVVVAAAAMTVRARFPIVAHYMFTVPAQYHILKGELLSHAPAFLASIVLFHVLFALWVFSGRRTEPLDRVSTWVLAAVGVLIPTSALAASKLGGAENSWMPAFFAMMLYASMQLNRHLARDERESSRVQAWTKSFALAAFLFLTFPRLIQLYHDIERYDDYRPVIDYVRSLPAGRVSAPEDPTILLFARGEIRRNAYIEQDTLGEPWGLPASTREELALSEFVVDVTPYSLLQSEDLERSGFRRLREFPHYMVWQRAAGAGGPIR